MANDKVMTMNGEEKISNMGSALTDGFYDHFRVQSLTSKGWTETTKVGGASGYAYGDDIISLCADVAQNNENSITNNYAIIPSTIGSPFTIKMKFKVTSNNVAKELFVIGLNQATDKLYLTNGTVANTIKIYGAVAAGNASSSDITIDVTTDYVTLYLVYQSSGSVKLYQNGTELGELTSRIPTTANLLSPYAFTKQLENPGAKKYLYIHEFDVIPYCDVRDTNTMGTE